MRGPDGKLECAEPTAEFLPCCWQAGELIRARCGDIPAEQCEQRVRDARANYVAAGVAGHLTVPGVRAEEWKDCGQCRDCFQPAFSTRPGNSAQFALAISNFDDPGELKRFRFGFIGSSDNHSARPGTGYKEYDRRQMTETTGARDETGRAACSVRRSRARRNPWRSTRTTSRSSRSRSSTSSARRRSS